MKKVIKKKFHFKDVSFAITVRQKLMQILSQFRFQNANLINEQEISRFLMEILKQKEIELKYIVQNVLRYDEDKDNMLSVDELV